MTNRSNTTSNGQETPNFKIDEPLTVKSVDLTIKLTKPGQKTTKKSPKITSNFSRNVKKSMFYSKKRGNLSYHQLEPSEYTGKYVIVDKNVKPGELVERIFRKEWFKRQQPKLLISVTGSAQNFQMKPNLKTVFRRGIARAAKATSAWIITGGTSSGVMKHIGEAMHEYSSWNENDKSIYDSKNLENEEIIDIPLIGFSTYHTLAKGIQTPMEDFQEGTIDEVKIPAEAGKNSNSREVFLDKHHTHFVLVSSKENQTSVENGGKANFGQEIDLWADTEKYIIKNWLKSKKSVDDDKKDIPALLISIQGGPGTLKTALEHLKEGIPMVAIRSSGGWTEIISDLCKIEPDDFKNTPFEYNSTDKSKQQILFDGNNTLTLKSEDPSFSGNFSGQFEGINAKLAVLVCQKLLEYKMNFNRDKQLISIPVLWLNQAIQLYEFKNLVTVFCLLNEDNDELDTAMMRAVLSAQASHKSDHQNFKINTKLSKILLAMQYNKAELIKDELFQDDSEPLDDKNLGFIFDEAIRFKKCKFIDMLLDMDFNFKAHVTPERLMTYYNHIRTNDHQVLYNAFELQNSKNRTSTNGNSYNYEHFEDLKKHLNQIETSTFGPEYEASFKGFSESSFKAPVDYPLKEMLFWATLSGEFELVDVFYKHLARYSVFIDK